MKMAIPRAVAARAVEAVCEALLANGCATRAASAGSLRRGKATVGDIEVVAQLGEQFGATLALQGVLRRLGIARGLPNSRGAAAPWGPAYYRATLPTTQADLTLPLDLFVVFPPKQWAVIYLIRTGSARFSQAFVTRLHRFNLRTEDGRLLDAADHVVPLVGEEDLFAACHLPYLAPNARDMDDARTAALFGRAGAVP